MFEDRQNELFQPSHESLNRLMPQSKVIDESFHLDKTKDRMKKVKFEKVGKQVWNTTQQRRYIKFLSTKAFLFDLSVHQKRKLKVNVQMSKIVKTKTPNQCHSHHQKMSLKYGSINHIISCLENKSGVNIKKAYMPIQVAQIKVEQKQQNGSVLVSQVEHDCFKQQVMMEEPSSQIYIRQFPKDGFLVKIQEK